MCQVTVVNILCPLIHAMFMKMQVCERIKVRCALPDSPRILPCMIPE